MELFAVGSLFLVAFGNWSWFQSIAPILTGVVFMLVIPLFTPFYILFFIRYWLKKREVTRDHSDTLDFMNSRDALWANQRDPLNPPYIIGCMSMEGHLDIEKFRTRCKELLAMKDTEGNTEMKKLKQYISKYDGFYVWKRDPYFKVEDHIRQLEENGTPVTYNDELELSEIMSQQLNIWTPDNKSPWEILVLHKSTEGEGVGHHLKESNEQQSVVIIKIHHAIGDGVSIVGLMLTNFVDQKITIKDWVNAPKIAWWQIVARYVWSVLWISVASAHYYLHEDSSALHGYKLKGDRHIVWSGPVDFRIVKNIKDRMNMTVNDVVMGCLSAALHTHMWQRGKKGGAPDHVTAIIPIALHDIQKPLVLENKFSLVPCRLPTGRMDPLQRLCETKKQLDLMKRSPDILANYGFVRTMMNTIPEKITDIIFTSTQSTMVASNVPGPKEVLSVFGQRLQRTLFFPPQRGNVGMGVSFLSYGGYMSVGVIVDKSLMPERYMALDLITGFEQHLHHLSRKLSIHTLGATMKKSTSKTKLSSDRQTAVA